MYEREKRKQLFSSNKFCGVPPKRLPEGLVSRELCDYATTALQACYVLCPKYDDSGYFFYKEKIYFIVGKDN